MLSHQELIELERRMRGRTVLSVYVNGEERDPAQQKKWRLDLRHALDDIATWLAGAPHEDREAFAACRTMVMDRLSSYRASVGAPGWAGFFTTDGEVHAGGLPVAVPTMAVWSTGGCLAPYFRALPEAVPVFVAVADRRKARLFRYAERRHKLLDTMRAPLVSEPPTHMGHPPRHGFHTGTRGSTGTDEAQREQRVATDRFLGEVAAALVKLASKSGWVILGGIPEVATALLDRLPAEMRHRAIHATGLDVHAAGGTVSSVARLSTLALRDAADLAALDEVAGAANAGGAGCTGWVESKRALQEGRVRELFMSVDFPVDNAAGAEEVVRAALESGAAIHSVGGQAGARLDDMGGLAARLRYPAPSGGEALVGTAAGGEWMPQ